MMRTKAKFITFEGIEGCGKTTQLQRLTAHLQELGQAHVVTKEPGGTEIGKQIRKILLHKDSDGMVPACEALLYLADRAQHHAALVRPNLDAGTWVISDRYQDSTSAYQGAARGFPTDELDRIFRLVTNNLKPDLTILLDLDPKVGLSRAKARLSEADMSQAEGRFEDEALHFHEAVRASFLQLAAAEPQRFAIVDAAQTPDKIAADIQAIIAERGYLV